MKLSFSSEYLSIKQFEETILPHFVVLTGRNGAGKTHFLKAISLGHVQVGEITKNKIAYFNYESYRLEDEKQFQLQSHIQERNEAWKIFAEKSGAHFRQNAAGFRKNIDEHYEILANISNRVDRPLLELREEDIGNDNLANIHKNYKYNLENYFASQSQIRGSPMFHSLQKLLRRIKCAPDLLSKSQFDELYEPIRLKDDLLPQQLGLQFATYYARMEENDYANFLNKERGGNRPYLDSADFERRYGPKPWDLLNKILGSFNDFQYQVNSPVDLNREDSFKLKLTHRSGSGVSPEFSSLSSGEKILLALASTLYKISSDQLFPEMILLDEVDASLHPSMIKNFLNVIQEVFLERGISVLVATHSPTTVALSPEDSIYLMNPSGPKRVTKTSAAEAINILSEGFATLSQGLTFFDQIAKSRLTIVTEGQNTLLIEKALNLHNIQGVDILKGAESKTGKNQIKTLYNFFCLASHKNPVLFVWDCDAVDCRSLENTGNTYAFVFDKNTNNRIATKGIENLFPEECFEGFYAETAYPDMPTSKSFMSNKKGEFTQKMSTDDVTDHFKNFIPLVNLVNQILQKTKP